MNNDEDDEVKPSVCELCDKCFYDSDELDKHYNEHTLDTTEYNVENHKTKPESLLKCGICGQNFNSAGKKYKCDICHRYFVLNSSMKRHKKEVHGVADDSSLEDQTSNGISYNSDATTEDENEEDILKYTSKKILNFNENSIKIEPDNHDIHDNHDDEQCD
ncbi:Hypothetical predicted protein [Mytilus galloprovincialis]|uniref:C2H2-type domain-containing protein n=1 Tax=Mytilus galloprovincialis TaxID=29158 RepID=A0A8B6E7K2_MYTGA|nr:Hypothetical predicted protein [Mytilus galloprovincialis]